MATLAPRAPFDAAAAAKAMDAKLLPFQREGVAFGKRVNGRVLIADEMGCGKSAQAIRLCLEYAGEGPVLVVCPASLRYTWAHEIEKWLPSLAPSEVSIAKGRSDREAVARKGVRFVIVTYSLFTESSAVAGAVRNRQFKVIVVDESHSLRTRDSQRTKLLLPIMKAAPRLMLLSGTPALARPCELYAQVHALDEDNFGTYTAYTKRYCAARRGRFGWDVTGSSNASELHAKLETVMVRRLKRDVLKQLPRKRRQLVAVEATGKALDESKKACALLKDASQAIASATNEEAWDARGEKQVALGDAWQKSGLAKAPAVAAYALDLLQNAGAKILVFAHHIAVMDALERDLVRGLKGAKALMRIDGKTPPKERQRQVESFQNNPGCRCALLSVTAAGTGLTLTAASAVLFAELHWTPGVLVQAEDRAHRIGQHASVNVHYLVLKDESQSVDMALWKTIGNKVKVVGKTIDGDATATLGATATTAPRSEHDALVSFFGAEEARAQQVAKADIRSFFAPRAAKKKAAPPSNTLTDEQRARAERNKKAALAKKKPAASNLDDAALIRATEEAERAAAAGGAAQPPAAAQPAPRPAARRYDPRTLLTVPAPALKKTRRSSEGSGSCEDPLDLCLSSDDEKAPARWPCGSCTFANAASRTTCEVCATPRTAGSSSTAPVARRSSAASGSTASVARRSSASSAGSSTIRYAFSVSANTGRVSAFSSREGAPFARLMDAFDPAALVDGEGRLLPLSADDLGLDDDEAARGVKRFIAAWRSLRAVDRQTLCGDELLVDGLDTELSKRRRSSGGECFDRGVARPRKRARAEGEEDDDNTRECPWCEKGLPGDAPDGSFCDWACASEHKLRRPNNSQASRSQLFALEHGVCVACDLDAHALYRRVRALTPPERYQVLLATPGFAPRGKRDRRTETCLECDYWQADHMIPVAEGGGCCSLDNFRTLCTPCHQKETNALRQRLVARKNAAAAAGTRDLRSFFPAKAK